MKQRSAATGRAPFRDDTAVHLTHARVPQPATPLAGPLRGGVESPAPGVEAMDCVARTVKGNRCKRPLEYGQISNWTTMRSTRGLIQVYYLIGHPELAGRWLAQRCELHDGPETVDFQAPAWERFDPAEHAAMVTGLDDWLERQRALLMDGITDRWQHWHGGYFEVPPGGGDGPDVAGVQGRLR
jgi:hypothetical protein